ncbi:hypothetical protein NEOLEDRAFT_34055 [Neolentinus lepideus HHB14362 ss-1]|uniref:F-box domain-containing protein n=1 Tax=Neolentinus lepideus HHB14362 ss-1 TaxID=1314782 RepID=A0A165W6W7_9AGAM|nr:hypothetical protein NEOLEDRAFT_34055 [Neolentinus lepideus HHB14362 ss-1]
MYSEDDEPQDLHRSEKLRPSRPFLKLYEEQEGAALLRVSQNGGEPGDCWEVALWRALRFLNVIKGFHEGSLDLTGRHEWRYLHYLPRWKRYLADFNSVAKHTVEDKMKVPSNQKEIHRNGNYVVTSPRSLEAFNAKWSPLLPWGFIYPETMVLIHVTDTYPEPKFQRLLLTHLPDEMLHRIFLFTSLSQALLLGMTCRLLRKISFERIYQRFSFGFGMKVDGSLPRPEDGNLDVVAQQDKVSFLRGMDSFMSRPHVAQKARYLRLDDVWQSQQSILRTLGDHSFFTVSDAHAYGVDIYGVDIDSAFYEPILTTMATVITATIGLRELDLFGILLSSAIVKAITCLPRLHTVTFRGCNFGPDLRLFPVQLPSSSSVLNLAIYPHDFLRDSSRYWSLLSICPRLRTVSASSPVGNRRVGVPPTPELRRIYNPWRTVERFSAEDFDLAQIPDLCSWIEEAKMSSPLRLTHFKLHTRWPMEKAQIFRLIRALEGAPLKILVLSYIRYAGLDLLDRIAEAFPDLVGLTLMHRRKYTRFHPTLVRFSVWPHASWEYADRLRRFKSLEHLGINFYCPTITDHLDHGMIERMESGAIDDSEVEEWAFPEELDNDTVVRAFSVHCPTLQTFTFYSYPIYITTYRIHRRPHRSPLVEPEMDTNPPCLYGKIPQHYNPWNDSWGGWETILPGDP